jgi:hypothetical protein
VIKWISRFPPVVPLALLLLGAILFAAEMVPAWASYVQCKLITNGACVNALNSFTMHQEPVPVALMDGATITPAGSDANLYTLTVAGNSHVLQCPTSIRKGTYNIRITYSGTVTGFTTVTSSCYKFPGGTQPSWSMANGLFDVLSCSAFDTSRLDCTALINDS